MPLKTVLTLIGLLYCHYCNPMVRTCHRMASLSLQSSFATEVSTNKVEKNEVTSFAENCYLFSVNDLQHEIDIGASKNFLEVLYAQLMCAAYYNQRISFEAIDSCHDDVQADTMLKQYLSHYAYSFIVKRTLVQHMKKYYGALQALFSAHDNTIDRALEEKKAKEAYQAANADLASLGSVANLDSAARKTEYAYQNLLPEEQKIAAKMQAIYRENLKRIHSLFDACATLHLQHSCCDISNMKAYLAEFDETRQGIRLYTKAPTFVQITWDTIFTNELIKIEALLALCSQTEPSELHQQMWSSCLILGDYLQDIGFYPHNLSAITNPTFEDIKTALETNTHLLAEQLEDGTLSFRLKKCTTALWDIMRQLYAPDAYVLPLELVVLHDEPRVKKNWFPISDDCFYVLPQDAPDSPDLQSLIFDAPRDKELITPSSSFESALDLPGTVSTTVVSSPESDN